MRSLQLKTSFPIVWGDLAFQNNWLRKIALTSLVMATLSLSLTIVLMNRKPLIVMMDAQANIVRSGATVPVESEAEKMARRYLDVRYVWQPSSQAAQLALAKRFIASQSLKAFEKTAAELVVFSKGKNVAQRVYPTAVGVDAKERRIEVTADRFTEIQGLKAATILRVNLFYQIGTRTLENPWGIYIIKEEEVQ